MDYPFDPLTLVPPGTTDMPEPESYLVAGQIRAIQLDIIAEEPRTFLGATTADIPQTEYAYSQELGTQVLGIDALRTVAEELAQALKDIIGAWPIVSQLKPDPDAYWFIGQLHPDPENTDTPVNHATIAFMQRFFELIHARGYTFVESVAYEILDFFMPDNWKQKNYLGNPALSGWYPPSCFIRPTSNAALHYLSAVQIQVIRLGVNMGLPIKFQIGEPWWWDGSYSVGDGRFAPCIYDPYTIEQYELETGKPVPTPWIENIFEPLSPENEEYAYWLRDKLGASTNKIRDNVKAAVGNIDATLLFFTPQIMSPASDLTNIMNFPTEHWAAPNYEFVQIEDYDWIIDGKLDLVPLTFDAATNALGYPRDVVHYFSGFILNAWDHRIWPWIDKAIRMAKEANMNFIYIWSYTQAMRDSIVYSDALPTNLEVPIFHMEPNWSTPVQINREYRTEVQRSRGGKEMRRADRSVPRKTVTFTSLMIGAEKRRFDAFLATWQGFRFYIPDRTRFVATTADLPPSAIGVTLDRIPMWIQLGTVVILSDGENLAARVVDRIIPETNSIELKAPDGVMTWPAGTRIYPALFGSLANEITSRRVNGHVTENMMVFNVVPGSELALRNPPPAEMMFDGVEVWNREPNWTTAPSITMATGREEVDYGVGTVTPYNITTFVERAVKYTYLQRTWQEAEYVQAFQERMLGQQGVFWVPTWEYDLVPTANNAGGANLQVEGDDIPEYLANDSVYRNLAIVDNEGGLWCFKIVSTSATGGDTNIQVTPDIPAGLIPRIEKISWLILSRMSTDGLTESWTTDSIASFDLNIQSLQASEK